MNTFRIIGIDRSTAGTEVRLNIDKINKLGRQELAASDPTVSNEHAQLSWRDDAWWILDAGSANGTLVRGRDIRTEEGPQRIDVLEPFQVGVGHYTVVSSGWRRIFFDDTVVELDMLPAYNAAVAKVTTRIARRVAIRNWGRQRTGPATIQFLLNGVGKTNPIEVRPVVPGGSVLLTPEFTVDSPALSSFTSATIRRQALTIRLNDQERTEPHVMDVYPAHQWIRRSGYSFESALAAFVLPHDEQVERFVQNVFRDFPDKREPEASLDRIYSSLSEDWSIDYLKEPPLGTDNTQFVRLPKGMLYDPTQKSGGGTCLDLALFVAACLECLHHQPVVAVLSAGSHWHVLVGCWQQRFKRREPILSVRLADWLEDMVLVDPNGFTRDSRYRRPYQRMLEETREQLERLDFLFAVDVSAARLSGIEPLTIDTDPVWSEDAAAARTFVESLFRTHGVQQSASSLLVGLLSIDSGATERHLRRAGIDPDAARQSVRARLVRITTTNQLKESTENDVDATRSYEEAIRTATALAAADGSAVVTDEHVLRALLRTTSAEFKRSLGAAGTSTQELLSTIEPQDASRSTIVLSKEVARARQLTLDMHDSAQTDAVVSMLNGLLSLSKPNVAQAQREPGQTQQARDQVVAALDEVLLSATALACGEHASVVDERHLLRAILAHDTEEIDALLQREGTSRDELLKSTAGGTRS